ncbi:MAG TPA: hypothetical protein VFH68_12360 [Polyangia bacterium]|nr:hypothetical protein [Polyangia bacterium]
MRSRRGHAFLPALVGVLSALAGGGCGSRAGAGGNPDAIAIVDDDAAFNQRGSLDAGELASRDAPAGDGSPADAGARDGGGIDLVVKVDAPVRQCSAPAVRCNGKAPESCSADGDWQSKGTACQYVCVAGLCTGECLPGAYQCLGATRQRCDGDGKWMDNLACPFICSGGDCAGVCIPARSRCLAGDLQTCSATGEWQSVGTASRELLANPGFDGPDLIWENAGIPVIYLANGSGASNTPDVVAQSPSNLAWFGGVSRQENLLSQRVTIPANAASVTLSFSYAIITAETSDDENDVFDISMVTAGGEVVPLAHLSDNNASGDWILFKAAVPPSLFGQTVTLELRGLTNATLVTSFYIDTLSLLAVACP